MGLGNMKVKNRLMSGFLIIAFFCVVCSGVGIYSTTQYGTLTAYMQGVILKTMDALLDLSTDLATTRLNNMLVLTKPDSAQIYLQTETASFNRAISTLDDVSKLSDLLKELSAEMQELYRAAYQSQEQVYSFCASGAYDPANPDHIALIEAMNNDCDALFEFVKESQNTLDGYTTMLGEKEVTLKTMSTILLYSVAGFSILIALMIAFYNTNSITRPMREVLRVLEDMAQTGNLHAEISDDLLKRGDEFGEMGRAFSSTMHMMTDNVDTLGSVARGNLAVKPQVRSKSDAMGIAMHEMVDQMNELFGRLIDLSAQLAEGSSQISNGSQSLAQGTTEQASAIEELSASIAQISDQSTDTAQRVREAGELAAGIRSEAEYGNSKMTQLVHAVREIDEASNSISKIIRVIDDIASQTNLLALNASVEAAHAGIHGKGFAVVAEEVKSLANRSAAAAKETTELIDNSIRKAVEGVAIAHDAEESLKKIVDGIVEAASIILKIAAVSADEATAISQINLGVEQVAQVLQVNSSASEQAASSSVALTNIAQELREMMDAFQLRGGERQPRLPLSASAGKAQTDYSKTSQTSGMGKY